MLEAGTYRTAAGELLHVRLDALGVASCEVESVDGSLREGRELRDADVLLSDDPDWPWRDPRPVPSLLILD